MSYLKKPDVLVSLIRFFLCINISFEKIKKFLLNASVSIFYTETYENYLHNPIKSMYSEHLISWFKNLFYETTLCHLKYILQNSRLNIQSNESSYNFSSTQPGTLLKV